MFSKQNTSFIAMLSAYHHFSNKLQSLYNIYGIKLAKRVFLMSKSNILMDAMFIILGTVTFK